MKKFILEIGIPISFPIIAVVLVWILSRNKPKADELADWFFLVGFIVFAIYYGTKLRVVLAAVDVYVGFLLYWTMDRIKNKVIYTGLVVLASGCLVVGLFSLIAILCAP